MRFVFHWTCATRLVLLILCMPACRITQKTISIGFAMQLLLAGPHRAGLGYGAVAADKVAKCSRTTVCYAWRDPSYDALEFFLNDITKQWQQAAKDYQHKMEGSLPPYHHKQHWHHHKPNQHGTSPPQIGHRDEQPLGQQQKEAKAIHNTQPAGRDCHIGSMHSSSSTEGSSSADLATGTSSASSSRVAAAAAMQHDGLLLDVADCGDAYMLFADVPGIGSTEHLTINLTENPDLQPAEQASQLLALQDKDGVKTSTQRGHMLTISGQRTRAALPPNDAFRKQHCLQERSIEPFQRSWVLPHDADSSRINAQVAFGVLTIRVPKARADV